MSWSGCSTAAPSLFAERIKPISRLSKGDNPFGPDYGQCGWNAALSQAGYRQSGLHDRHHPCEART